MPAGQAQAGAASYRVERGPNNDAAVHVCGSLTAHTARGLYDGLSRLSHEPELQFLRLSFSGVTELDSPAAAAVNLALDDVQLSVRAGQIVAILGGSGSGKSTLLETLAALRPPLAGSLLLLGEDPQALDNGALRRLHQRWYVVPERCAARLTDGAGQRDASVA